LSDNGNEESEKNETQSSHHEDYNVSDIMRCKGVAEIRRYNKRV
jgi:hypothetical protein